MNKNGIKVTILTKGIYPKELTNTEKYSSQNEYGITVTSLDKEFKKQFEPYSPPPIKRIKALKFLHKNGLKTWASIEPYPTPNTVPNSTAGRDLNKILSKISFVNKIVFGKMNYNVVSRRFENNKEFYSKCSKKVVDFCKKNGILYHIKEGTPGYNPKTEKIFKD